MIIGNFRVQLRMLARAIRLAITVANSLGMMVMVMVQATSDVEVSAVLTRRMMRSHAVTMSKRIAHSNKWQQQNHDKSVHQSIPVLLILAHKSPAG